MSEYQAACIVDLGKEGGEGKGDHEDAEGHGETEALGQEEMAMDELMILENNNSVVGISTRKRRKSGRRNPSYFPVMAYTVFKA